MRLFGAILLDAYHELNSKKLFWVILAMSGMMVLTFGSFGFHEDGMSMFYGLKTIESDYLTKDSIVSRVLYRSIFTYFMVGFWLAWAATILALVSTTTIFPDFIASGAIDLVLSKPISRITLFFYKYIASLLFMVLQVGLFCLGIFLCLGLRLGDWDWKIFLAIPILTVFFSYLYSVNVLVGVWTRSALAALLITMLTWFSLFSTAAADSLISLQRFGLVIESERTQESIESLETRLERMNDPDDPAGPNDPRPGQLVLDIQAQREALKSQQDVIASLDRWRRPVKIIMAVLPKTGETVNLLDRALTRETDVNIMDIFAGNVVPDGHGGFRSKDTSNDRERQRRLNKEINSRSMWWVLGTSLLFEAFVLAGACVIFVRRDF